MKNKVYFGIEIFTTEGVKRFAQVRGIVETDQGKEVYLPYLSKAIPIKSELSLEGKSPVPSVSFEIADGDRDLIDSMEGLEYESFEVMYKVFDNDFIPLYSISGYITDVSYSEGMFKASFRTDEDKSSYDFLRVFSYDSFQNIEVLRAENAKVQAAFSAKSDAVWSIFKTSLPRKKINSQRFQIRDKSHFRLSTKTNTYTDYEQVEAFAIVLDTIDDTVTASFNFDPGTGIVFVSNTPSSGDSLSEILEDLAADAVSEGLAANVVDGNRIYIEGDPTEMLNLTNVSLYYDPDSAGSTTILKPVEKTIFENPGGASYKVAILGDAGSASVERIAYCYCLKGQYYDTDGDLITVYDEYPSVVSEFYYLSGVPTTLVRDPAALFGSGDLTDMDPAVSSLGYAYGSDLDDFLGFYGIGNDHDAWESITPYGVRDTLYVAANGLEISSPEDPNLGSGFISLGETFRGPEEKEYLRFHRYKIVEIYNSIYNDNQNNGEIVEEIYKLEIHNKLPTVDPTHTYTFDVGTMSDIQLDVTPDAKIYLAGYEYNTSYLDLHMGYVSDELYSRIIDTSTRDEVLESFKDRYKGFRVDMFDDYSEFTQDVDRQITFDSDEYVVSNSSRENQRLINNASGKFAVCTGSELIVTEPSNYITERLYFYFDNSDKMKRLYISESTLDGDASEFQQDNVGFYDIGGRPEYYVNYMTYKPEEDSDSSTPLSSSLAEQDALNYFLSKRYRVIHDPVPEKSEDLGKYFPVAYGYVRDVPLLGCVSKKAMEGVEQTAGDDYYVYASHACDIRSESDIVIRIFDDAQDEKNADSDFSSNLKDVIIKSPFPSYVDDHYEMIGEDAGEAARLTYFGRLFNPYHRLIDKQTIEGDTTYGIKLNGDLWDFRAGKMDRRYPIRNGVGSQKVFASFGGWNDKTGKITGSIDSLIEHPCDIISHFVQYYGRYPFNKDMIDPDNLRIVKSRTQRYRAACFINEQITASEFIQDICRQFALFPYISDGAVKVANIDLSRIDSSNPIIEGLNLLDGVEQESEAYKDIYSEISFSYKKNWASDSYEGLVFLNKNNNEMCAKAARSKGGKGSFSMEADYCYDDYTARRVASTYARILSARKIRYSLRVKRIDRVDLKIGDVVPMTYSKYDLDSEPVLISALTDRADIIDVEVIRFV